MTEKEFLPGETVVVRGDIVSHLFLIKRGRVRLECGDESFFLSENDFFGEEGCFFGKPAAFTATVCEETLLELMDSSEAEKFFSENGDKAFSLFIKNSARANDRTEPLALLSPLHIRLIAGLLPYVVEKDGENPEYEAGIDAGTLAEQLELTEEKLADLLRFSGIFGYVSFDGGKIMTCGKEKLLSLFKEYNRERIFAGVKGENGLGMFSFLSVVNAKDNI